MTDLLDQFTLAELRELANIALVCVGGEKGRALYALCFHAATLKNRSLGIRAERQGDKRVIKYLTGPEWH